MVIITSLKQTTAENITVCLNDGTEIKSTLGVITDLRLYSGKELDDEELSNIKSRSEQFLAVNKAADLLSRRLMSEKELRDKLINKGFEEQTADYCVEKLKNLGAIDDSVYASAVVRHYAAKSYGYGRIKDELYRRGIPRDLWDDVLNQIPNQDDKISNYISSHLKDPSDQKQVKKVCDALYRRGFSWEEIKHALRKYDE